MPCMSNSVHPLDKLLSSSAGFLAAEGCEQWGFDFHKLKAGSPRQACKRMHKTVSRIDQIANVSALWMDEKSHISSYCVMLPVDVSRCYCQTMFLFGFSSVLAYHTPSPCGLFVCLFVGKCYTTDCRGGTCNSVLNKIDVPLLEWSDWLRNGHITNTFNS